MGPVLPLQYEDASVDLPIGLAQILQGVHHYERMDPGDNGIYVIDGWKIVDRAGLYEGFVEQQEYGFDEMLRDFNMPIECREHGDWQRVYREGCDSKYGTIMVSHEMRARRHPTFDEFYGSAAVD